MYFMKRASVVVCALALAAGVSVCGGGSALAAAIPQPQQAAQNAAKQVIGAIQAINGSTITLKPDTGADVSVTVQGAVRVLRVAPGQTDLKTATPIQLKRSAGGRPDSRPTGTPSGDGQPHGDRHRGDEARGCGRKAQEAKRGLAETRHRRDWCSAVDPARAP